MRANFRGDKHPKKLNPDLLFCRQFWSILHILAVTSKMPADFQKGLLHAGWFNLISLHYCISFSKEQVLDGFAAKILILYKKGLFFSPKYCKLRIFWRQFWMPFFTLQGRFPLYAPMPKKLNLHFSDIASWFFVGFSTWMVGFHQKLTEEITCISLKHPLSHSHSTI